LLKTHVKPGDTVSRGDVLLELDGRPLRLERESIEAEIQQVVKTHDVALATRRIADAQQAAFKEQHLRRQYDLLSDRLQRLEVISPIDGIVVSGDLEKFVGSPLERGQTLIEVAPMDRMIIEIEIPEHEIGFVKKGAKTRIKIDAIGGKSIRVPLSEIFPAAEIRNDRNIFVGRIELDNPDQKLRPGMRGEATMYGPLRPWIWSWVRGGIERVLWWMGY
jgi:multidrug resistance efflux pump